MSTSLAGYWVDLETVQLSFDNESTWIQAMPLGTYNHPIWGTMTFTPERVDTFVKNFNDRVRGTDIDIDYDHKVKTDKAAGWVKAAENRGASGLWIKVEWTPDALKALRNKEYRYFSPEYADEWTSPKGDTYRDVLVGGALTNRPFLKDILPINLSEIWAGNSNKPPKEEGKQVDLKELAK